MGEILSVHIVRLVAAAAGGGIPSRGVCSLPRFGTHRLFIGMITLLTVTFRAGHGGRCVGSHSDR